MFCRGKMMEESEEFNMEKLVDYLYNKLPYMRTKNEIKGFNKIILTPKNPLPYQLNMMAKSHARSTRNKDLHWKQLTTNSPKDDLRESSGNSEGSIQRDSDADKKDFRITRLDP